MTTNWPVAIDQVYQSRVSELHRPLRAGELVLQEGLYVLKRPGVSITAPASLFPDVVACRRAISPFFSNLGLHTMYLLYEIANDEPFWRTPHITVNGTELLERLCLRRDARGIHYTRNRQRVAAVLGVAHHFTFAFEGQVSRPLIRVKEWSADAWDKRLPREVSVELLYYDGVRKNDRRGNHYVLVPRRELVTGFNLRPTTELLAAYLCTRYQQTRHRRHVPQLTRKTLVEKAGITCNSRSWQKVTLRRAIDELIETRILAPDVQIPAADDDCLSYRWGPALLNLTARNAFAAFDGESKRWRRRRYHQHQSGESLLCNASSSLSS